MKQNNLWFIESGVTFFALVCYSLQNKLSSNDVILVKNNKQTSFSLRQKVLNNIPNIKIIKIIDDLIIPKEKLNLII